MEQKKVVIALGGNALGNNVEEQQRAVLTTAKAIADLIEQGMQVVVSHGNGPQVGMIQSAMDQFVANNAQYTNIPLPHSVAMSQGYIGLDLADALTNELKHRGIEKPVSALISRVEVEAEDPAFQNPTKPIGRFMSKEEAEELEKQGVNVMEDAGRGYRIVVASPMPKRIVELNTVKALSDAGHVVITCGGGGIPVVQTEEGMRGIPAVIDKDNASSLLAAELDADFLVILTAVEKVAINFGKENQEWLSSLTVEQARQYIQEEQFAKGSMLPKVEAAIRFAESGEGRNALITLLEKASDGLAGKTGTRITK